MTTVGLLSVKEGNMQPWITAQCFFYTCLLLSYTGGLFGSVFFQPPLCQLSSCGFWSDAALAIAGAMLAPCRVVQSHLLLLVFQQGLDLGLANHRNKREADSSPHRQDTFGIRRTKAQWCWLAECPRAGCGDISERRHLPCVPGLCLFPLQLCNGLESVKAKGKQYLSPKQFLI